MNKSFHFAGFHGKYKVNLNNEIPGNENIFRGNLSQITPSVLTLHNQKTLKTILFVENIIIYVSCNNVIGFDVVGNKEEVIFSSENDSDIITIQSLYDNIIIVTKHGFSDKYLLHEVGLSRKNDKKNNPKVMKDIETTNYNLFSIGKRLWLISNGKDLYKIDREHTNICLSKIQNSENFTIKKIACGYEHAIILTNDNRVFTLGNGSRGQLGNGSTEYTQQLIEVDMLQPINIIDVTAGGWHSLVLSESGDLYSWGWNESGQVGVIDDKRSPQKLVFLPTLLDTPLDIQFKSIGVGSRHSAAVTTTGVLYMWGWNGYGQLFHEDQNKCQYQPSQVDYFVNNKFSVESVLCGKWSTVAETK